MEPFVPHSHMKILIIFFVKNLRIKIFIFVSLFVASVLTVQVNFPGSAAIPNRRLRAVSIQGCLPHL